MLSITVSKKQNLAKPPRVTIFHRRMASCLTNRTKMKHLALPLTVKKIYSSLCACICVSWQVLPQPLIQGHGLHFDPWGWLYHYLLHHFSFFHTQAFFITQCLCLFLSGHLASGVAYPDDMLRTIQERKEEKSFLITLCWIDHSTDWAGCNSQRWAPRVLGTERSLAYGNVKTKHVSSQSHSQDHTAIYSFWHFSTGCFL